MSIRNAHLLGCLLVFTALAACTPSTPTLTKLQAGDAGSTVHMKKGDTLEIALDANPSTGYTWEVASDTGALLIQQGDGDFQANSSALGAGGIFTLRFKPRDPGTTHLELIYHRPFEPNLPPLQTFDIEVIVDE